MGTYCDKFAPQSQRPLVQATLWTFFVFTFLILELRKTLLRVRQLFIGLGLLLGHLFVLYEVWRQLPFESSVSIIILGLLEAVALGLLYIRIEQSLDPDGPFGPSEEEKERKVKVPKII